MKGSRNKSDLQKIPGIGPKIEQYLIDIGITCISDFIGKSPEKLYKILCKNKKSRVDKCVLYVFRCAVYFAENKKYDSNLLKWWNWKD